MGAASKTVDESRIGASKKMNEIIQVRSKLFESF